MSMPLAMRASTTAMPPVIVTAPALVLPRIRFPLVVMVGLVPTIHPSACSGVCGWLDLRDRPEDGRLDNHVCSRRSRALRAPARRLLDRVDAMMLGCGPNSHRIGRPAMADTRNVEALLFDVFGTVVD